jgi:curved DNA-binding protein CbpA
MIVKKFFKGVVMPKEIALYPIPIILKEILKNKSSGELIIKFDNFKKSIFFFEGDLIFAKTNVIQERLGEILFKLGKIDSTQYWNINKLINEKNDKIGRLLVQNKILNQRDIFYALLYQIRAIATSTFMLTTGEWEFFNKIPEIPLDSRFKIEIPGIIIDGISKIKDISYYKSRFQGMVPKAHPIADSIGQVLTTEEIQLYKDLVEYSSLTNIEIINKLGIPEPTYWRKIILFFLLNIIEFKKSGEEQKSNKNLEDLLKLYDKMESQKMDFYEILGIKNTVPHDVIKNTYFNLAKKYHPDRLNFKDPEITEKANYVFAEINKAFDTLNDDERRRKYDTVGYKEAVQNEHSADSSKEQAHVLFRKAKTLYSQKMYREAISLLEDALRMDPDKSSYWLLLGLSQMNDPLMKRNAEKSLQCVIEKDPWNTEPLAALGILYLSENQTKRAEGFFRKTLSINPEHPLAKKKLQEILNSSSQKKSVFSVFGKKKK